MNVTNKIYKSIQLIQEKNTQSKVKKNAHEAIKNFQKPYCLHIGCGNIKFENWVNIDLEATPNVTDIVWDASQNFSFIEAESCLLIYNEHFLEHLDIQQGLNFLAECHRLLQPDGVLRVAMPSLEYIVQKYSSEDWRNQDWLRWSGHEFIKTPAEMLNISFRWWGHQWLYDQEEIQRRLHEVGFQKLRKVEWGISEISELNNRESRMDSMLIYEAQK